MEEEEGEDGEEDEEKEEEEEGKSEPNSRCGYFSVDDCLIQIKN